MGYLYLLLGTGIACAAAFIAAGICRDRGLESTADALDNVGGALCVLFVLCILGAPKS